MLLLPLPPEGAGGLRRQRRALGWRSPFPPVGALDHVREGRGLVRGGGGGGGWGRRRRPAPPRLLLERIRLLLPERLRRRRGRSRRGRRRRVLPPPAGRGRGPAYLLHLLPQPTEFLLLLHLLLPHLLFHHPHHVLVRPDDGLVGVPGIISAAAAAATAVVLRPHPPVVVDDVVVRVDAVIIVVVVVVVVILVVIIHDVPPPLLHRPIHPLYREGVRHLPLPHEVLRGYAVLALELRAQRVVLVVEPRRVLQEIVVFHLY